MELNYISFSPSRTERDEILAFVPLREGGRGWAPQIPLTRQERRGCGVDNLPTTWLSLWESWHDEVVTERAP